MQACISQYKINLAVLDKVGTMQVCLFWIRRWNGFPRLFWSEVLYVSFEP